MDFLNFYQKKKQTWVEASLNRELQSSVGIDFCSNDYLGLSGNKDLKNRILAKAQELPLGSTGSRLIRGHSSFTDKLENRLAEFSGSQAALSFATGYQANVGLFSSLLKEQAVVFSDESVHASIIDGIKLSGCEKYIWSHNNVEELELFLKQKVQSDKLNVIVVESIYSMKGDKAPLRELVELSEKYQCHLVVDEAHATGLFGNRGSGLVEELGLTPKVLATVHTAGKALGVSGAWVACSQELKHFLVNKSRPFIYSTAPSYIQQSALLEAIEFLSENRDNLIESFFTKLATFQNKLLALESSLNVELSGVGGPVTSLVVFDNERALRLTESLKTQGFDVRAIRPPTVPQGEAMLRITCPLSRTDNELQSFVGSLKFLLKEES